MVSFIDWPFLVTVSSIILYHPLFIFISGTWSHSRFPRGSLTPRPEPSNLHLSHPPGHVDWFQEARGAKWFIGGMSIILMQLLRDRLFFVPEFRVRRYNSGLGIVCLRTNTVKEKQRHSRSFGYRVHEHLDQALPAAKISGMWTHTVLFPLGRDC